MRGQRADHKGPWGPLGPCGTRGTIEAFSGQVLRPACVLGVHPGRVVDSASGGRAEQPRQRAGGGTRAPPGRPGLERGPHWAEPHSHPHAPPSRPRTGAVGPLASFSLQCSQGPVRGAPVLEPAQLSQLTPRTSGLQGSQPHPVPDCRRPRGPHFTGGARARGSLPLGSREASRLGDSGVLGSPGGGDRRGASGRGTRKGAKVLGQAHWNLSGGR